MFQSKKQQIPICIAGMHRSGTSMVTRLLNLCGVYLGPEAVMSATGSDNEAGFWEHRDFVALNDAILALLGGGWDFPPVAEPGWEWRDDLAPLRQRAAQLIGELSSHGICGWKDPRNSLTLPFWKRSIPDVKTVVCLRHPCEVADSLFSRSFSSRAFGFNLWLTYNRGLLSNTKAADRIVTHYEAYFYEPQEELRRVLRWLNIAVPASAIDNACATISTGLRHNRISAKEADCPVQPAELAACYKRLCEEAGPVYKGSAT
jgi:hypothetical protein